MDKKDCCCSERHKDRSEEEKKKLMNRLKRIAYCPDILIQVSAVNAALNSFNKELLAKHIKTCVVDDIKEGHDETIDELVNVLQKVMK